MPRKSRGVTFDELPLFAEDHLIAEACVGADPEKIALWLGKLRAIEQTGFPKKSHLYGMRYTPAVKAFYDREYLPGERSELTPYR